MEMSTTPLSSMFPCMSVEHREEALTANVVKIGDKRVRVFHSSPVAFIFGEANLVGGILGGMAVENLDTESDWWISRKSCRTHAMCVEFSSRYGFGASIGRLCEPHDRMKAILGKREYI